MQDIEQDDSYLLKKMEVSMPTAEIYGSLITEMFLYTSKEISLEENVDITIVYI